MKKKQYFKSLLYTSGVILSIYTCSVHAEDWHVNNFMELKSSVNTAVSGDTIYIAPGIYTAPETEYDKEIKAGNKSLTFIGDGGRPEFRPNANVKGIFTSGSQADMTFENIAFFNATNSSRNGSGIWADGGHLVVRNCYFEGNNNGIQMSNGLGESVKIYDSEFVANGYGDGRSHGVYLHLKTILIEDSIFRGTKVGNQIKALGTHSTTIRNNIIDDGIGNPSRAIDSTAGGDLLIEGNTFYRTANADNYRLIYYAINRTGLPAGIVTVQDNTIYNSYPNALLIANDSDIPVSVINNQIHNNGGHIDLTEGLANSSNNQIDNVLQPAISYKDGAILGTPDADSQVLPSFYRVQQKYDFLGGNDNVETGDGSETIFAGTGHDTIFSGGGSDYIFGEEGDDIIFGGSGDVYVSLLSGGDGNDIIIGGTSGDTLIGGKGNDILYGVNYGDKLAGNAGNDILIGGSNSDYRLYGGTGNDFLDAGAGNDYLKGGDGNDILISGIGHDSTFGGAGIDTAVIAGNYQEYTLSEGRSWHRQPSINVNPVSESALIEVSQSGENYQEVEYLQFNDGVYDVLQQTFVTGAQNIDLTLYEAVRIQPESIDDIVFFFGSQNPNNNDSGDTSTETVDFETLGNEFLFIKNDDKTFNRIETNNGYVLHVPDNNGSHFLKYQSNNDDYTLETGTVSVDVELAYNGRFGSGMGIFLRRWNDPSKANQRNVNGTTSYTVSLLPRRGRIMLKIGASKGDKPSFYRELKGHSQYFRKKITTFNAEPETYTSLSWWNIAASISDTHDGNVQINVVLTSPEGEKFNESWIDSGAKRNLSAYSSGANRSLSTHSIGMLGHAKLDSGMNFDNFKVTPSPL